MLEAGPEALETPAARTAFSLALMGSDLYVPVEQSAAEQKRDGGVSLQAIAIDDIAHVLLFTSREKLASFADEGTRFARASGKDIFPNLRGAHAVLNPGPLGRQFTPDDIASLLSKNSSDSGSGCGPECGPSCGSDCGSGCGPDCGS